MQTSRHRLFAALAVCVTACSGKPKQGATVSPVVPPSSAPDNAATQTTEPETKVEVHKVARRPPAEPVQGAPKLTLVRLTAPQTVTLHFNEPVAVTEGFDPRQFRLSLGHHYREEDGYTVAYYYDPGAIDDPELSTTVMDLIVDDDTNMHLVLSRPLSRDTCDEARDLAAEMAENPGMVGGLFLHYRDAAETGVEDNEGNRLEDIAPQWIERGASTASYTGTNLPPIAALGPIPCLF